MRIYNALVIVCCAGLLFSCNSSDTPPSPESTLSKSTPSQTAPVNKPSTAVEAVKEFVALLKAGRIDRAADIFLTDDPNQKARIRQELPQVGQDLASGQKTIEVLDGKVIGGFGAVITVITGESRSKGQVVFNVEPLCLVRQDDKWRISIEDFRYMPLMGPEDASKPILAELKQWSQERKSRLMTEQNNKSEDIKQRIARTKADMLTLARALYAYGADLKTFPACAVGPRSANAGDIPSFRMRQPGEQLRTLTTPVAYLTKLPIDLFAESGNTFGYYCPGTFEGADGKGALGNWIIWSPGPDGKYDITLDVLKTKIDFRRPQPQPSTMLFGYDPTNGALSAGDIIFRPTY